MKIVKFVLMIVASISVMLSAAYAAPRPNIILVMADDMGWGDPGYYSSAVTYADGSPHVDQGWINTPTMDAMAASGLRFDRFYSASSVCSPTRASCLTGRNPVRVGIGNANSGRLGFDETPLSEVLSNAGYVCGHLGKWHVGTMTTLRTDGNRGRSGNEAEYSAPWHHQYDFCFATESKVPTYHPYSGGLPLATSFEDSNFYGTRYWRIPATWNETSGEGDIVPIVEVNNLVDGDDSKLLVDQAIPFMQDAVANNTPFFLVLWFHTPHKPVIDPDGVTSVNSPDAAKDSIEDMDFALSRVRDELTNLGVRDNTMFWVTSDNGPENGVDSFNETEIERPMRSGRHRDRKGSFYEGGIIVPGILEWPDVITSGRITDIPAVTSDYYPTILDYLELSVPGQKPLDGVSLRPVIENTITERVKPIGFKKGSDKAWIDNQYKLVNANGTWELFDLVNFAPGEESEQTPLADENNVTTKSQAIQDLYNSMLAQCNAWETTVNQDTPNIHFSQPTVVLNADAEVYAPFTVSAIFNEAVFQLHAGEFVVTNGTPSNISGSGTSWTVTITPSVYGPVTIALPEGCVIDADGNINADSGVLSVNYLAPPANYPPTFNTDPVVENNATEGALYNSTLADDASDAESDPLTFSRIAGPSWLSVASDGSLGGSPDLVDLGLNSWSVQVSDGNDIDTATLQITVDAASGSWSELMYDDFEAGFGNWIDGGANCQWYNDAAYAHQGSFTINLQAIGEESVMSTADLALSGMSRILLSCWAYTKNFNESEDVWLQISTDGGANYTTVRTWTLDVELFNDQFVSLSHEISGLALTDQTRLRFRCDASGTRDDIYLDEIQVLVDSAPPQNQPPAFTSNPVIEVNATENAAYSSSIADNASDSEGDAMTFAKVSGPAWLSVATDGALSGTPGAGDVGLNSFAVQVDATGGSDIATLEITVDSEGGGGPTDDYAGADVIGNGTIGGNYADTQASDNVYESVTEIESGGKPANRYSVLEHKWTINVTGGNSVIFYVEAYKTANSEGDDFVFAYSTDNVNFTDMVTVTKTGDDNVAQSYTLPSSLNGTVYIRVKDTDSTAGNKGLDSVYIDEMHIRSDGTPPPNGAPSFSSDPVVEANATENAAYGSSIADNASDPESDPMTFSKVSGAAWLSVAANGALSGTPGAGDVGLNSFTVQVDATGGSDTATLEITVDAEGTIPDIYISDIAMSSAASGGNRYSGIATITVKDEFGATVSGSTVSVDWSGVAASSASATTDGSGVVVFESGRVKNGGTYTVTVSDVTASGYNYNPALNAEISDSVTAP